MDSRNKKKPGPENSQPLEDSTVTTSTAEAETNLGEETVADVEIDVMQSDETEISDTDPIVEVLQREIDRMTLELDEANDRTHRAHAETENVRRRMHRERENAEKYSITKFAKELLTPLDTFDNALTTLQDSDTDQSVVQGFGLSVKALMDAVSKFGVVAFDPRGEVFDPERHKAVTYAPHKDAEPGTVTAVLRKGYLIHDRLLREAEVVVAKEPE